MRRAILFVAMTAAARMAAADPGPRIGDVSVEAALGAGERVTPHDGGTFAFSGGAGIWIGRRVQIGARISGLVTSATTGDGGESFDDTLFVVGPAVTAYVAPPVFVGLALGITGDDGPSYAGGSSELVSRGAGGELRVGADLLRRPWGSIYLAASLTALETRDYGHREASRQLGLVVGIQRW